MLARYEMANLCRDQQAAELGDHKRGLGSDDLPAIQKVPPRPRVATDSAPECNLSAPLNFLSATDGR